MTTKPVNAQAAARRLPPLPSPPKYDMEQTRHFVLAGILETIAKHLDAMIPGSTTLVGGNGYLCQRRTDLPRCPYPDMLVSFNVDWEDAIYNNGYVIEEAGKPPDLVLEVASHRTGRRDYIDKREIYASLGVPEYWRFDHTGGRYHDAPLACDLLTPNGGYQPMPLTTEPDGVIWGYSEILGLSVCWVERRLRFWDRAQQRYLPNQREQADELADTQAELNLERQARADADARADREAQARTEETARADREAARRRELEAELRRRDNP